MEGDTDQSAQEKRAGRQGDMTPFYRIVRIRNRPEGKVRESVGLLVGFSEEDAESVRKRYERESPWPHELETVYAGICKEDN